MLRDVARALALRTLLAQLTFAVLTGNGDAHARNSSILAQPDGKWRISPAYDLPGSQPYGDLTLAMPVNARRTEVGAKDLHALAATIGLPPEAAAFDRADSIPSGRHPGHLKVSTTGGGPLRIWPLTPS